jgi:GDPmannose 4,6-dehydratase
MFGASLPPQNEKTLFYPRSPYAAAKVYSYWMVVNYREGYNLFACNGILFNHESPRRGEIFVSRKISRAVANILAGKQKILYLGNLKAKRDWGYAPEYVVCQWLILQQERPDDYVIGTGESHTVQEFVEQAFSYVGLDWQKYVQNDPKYFRPTEVDHLQADITKARKKLNWLPKVKFSDLVKIMVDADLELIGLKPIGKGQHILEENNISWTKNKLTVG